MNAASNSRCLSLSPAFSAWYIAARNSSIAMTCFCASSCSFLPIPVIAAILSSSSMYATAPLIWSACVLFCIMPMRVCKAMYFNVCSRCSSALTPSNINFLFSSLAGCAILPAISENLSKPFAAVPPNSAKSFELVANREFIFSISALVTPNFSIVPLTPDMPCAVVNPTSLNLLNASYTLSLYSAPISISLVEPCIATPKAATAAPAILEAIPRPGKNINAAPIPYATLVISSLSSFSALAPTLAPRSPLYSESAIEVAALVTPEITAVPANKPVVNNLL